MASSSNQNMGALPLSFPLLNGESYDFWCVKMKTQLMSNDVWEYVQDGFEDCQGISDNLFPRIINETQAKKAWDILYNEYRGNLKVKTIKLQFLRRDYENLKMKDNELFSQFECRRIDGSLKTFEQRLNRQSEKSIESAFQSKLNVSTPKPHGKGSSSSHNQSRGEFSSGGNFERGRGGNDRGRGRGMNNFQRGNNFQARGNDEATQPRCGICKRGSHVDKYCWFRGKPQCYNCNKFGHVKKGCRVTNNQQANYSEEQEGGGCKFYACQAASEQKNDVWFLDSGCSNHMTGDESIFVKIDTSSNSQVKMGNGA
ncbi:uncharacterized protein LOC131328556 [Rhododendron vialii]|uniref:uncharacterized protein LOC131328556 n=1 Tax=Rhododendron vialii TaxID=182163 RepID=UPI00265F0C6E|nr:uncharacterized protein LOC131328556 [Rhododendron vialii]